MAFKWGKFFNVFVFITIISIVLAVFILPKYTHFHSPFFIKKNDETVNYEHLKIKTKAQELKEYALNNGYDTTYAFIIDMSIASGYKRFFVYHFKADTVINSGLVAHGSCNTMYLEKVKFNNTNGCGCSANGIYKIDYSYIGNYGKAFKLRGLQPSNNNAFERNIVLHSYSCVPDEETYPSSICNSLGCPMVSINFLNTLMIYIKDANQPILLWILND